MQLHHDAGCVSQLRFAFLGFFQPPLRCRFGRMVAARRLCRYAARVKLHRPRWEGFTAAQVLTILGQMAASPWLHPTYARVRLLVALMRLDAVERV